MNDIITYSESYDKGSAYGVILLSNGAKDVAYGSGPWKRQTALLCAVKTGLEAANPNPRVHLPRPQIAQYMKAGLIQKWKENGWKKLNGSDIDAVPQWSRLLTLNKKKNPKWIEKSDHKLMPWARRCALCAMAEVDIHTLKNTEEEELVTDEQVQVFWVAAEEAGHTKVTARRLLSDFGVISIKDLPEREFEAALERVKSPALVDRYKI